VAFARQLARSVRSVVLVTTASALTEQGFLIRKKAPVFDKAGAFFMSNFF